MLIPVILSGGAGTRLWPVSRHAYPKPFMQLADGETLMEKTFRRAADVASDGKVVTMTGRDYFFITQDAYRKMAEFDESQHQFLLEPMGRNTAPAIAIAALALQAQYGGDTQMLVLPADHLVKDAAAFAQAVQTASSVAANGRLVTFGINPTHPETGYGYIQSGEALDQDHAFSVQAFVEKPDLPTAEKYLASGEYAWNSGMFLFRVDAILNAMQRTCPDVLAAAKTSFAATDMQSTPVSFDADTFAQAPNISIDYAVMEKADNCAVVRGDFGWSDIGSWKAVSELSTADNDGNRVRGPSVQVDTKNTYIQSEERLIATVGVNNLVVIDTKDAVLVADKDRSQDVKSVVNSLKSEGHEAATFHQTVHRPWGSYTILEDADDCKVKRLVVKPGQVLSLQLHHRRTEHWTVVSGTAKVRVGDKEFLLNQNESVYIPLETLHRLENPGEEPIALIEVQCGDYFGEDDIERFEDVYGRA